MKLIDGRDWTREPVTVLALLERDDVRQPLETLLSTFENVRLISSIDDICHDTVAESGEWPVVALVEPQDALDILASEQLGRCWPRIRSLVLATYMDRKKVIPSFLAGVNGYIEKSVSAETLVSAVRAVAAGGLVLDATFCSPSRLLSAESVVSRPQMQLRRILNLAQIRMIHHVANGESLEVVASRLDLTRDEVSRSLDRLEYVIGVGGRAALLNWAREHGAI